MRPFVILLALLVPAGGAAPQAAPDSGRWTGTHRVEQRWLHAEQVPEVTPYTPAELRLRLDSAAVGAERSYLFRVVDRRQARRGVLRIPGNHRPIEAWVEPAMPPDGPSRFESRRMRHSGLYRRLTAGDGVLLEDARLWDLAPLAVPELGAGATIRDTLRLGAERFGFLQSMDGPRVVTMERDTVVEGRRLWIGRDSARIRYRERVLAPRRSLDTVVVIEREVEGVLRGRFLYDPELGLFRARSDTLSANGTATLRLPDDRAYATPATFERRTEWALRSASEQRAWEEEDRRRRRASSFSIVRLPRTPEEERLARGDTVFADSLLGAWASAGVGDRGRIQRLLSFAPTPFRERMDSLRLEAGGWAARVGAMTRAVFGGPPVDSADMSEYLRLLGDPGLSHAHGINPDAAYENLAGGLATYPPSLDAPPNRTSCSPAACRLVAAERDAAEPRLRQVAMVASFILDPERWADSLLSRRDTAAHLLHPGVLLARGVGATWPFAEKLPIPPAGADWREWLRWTGTDDDPGRDHGGPPRIEFQSSHGFAVRMSERLTGRDIGAELASAAASAVSDSARIVFRTLALRLGAIEPTVDEVVAGFRSSDPYQRRIALLALPALHERFVPADSALRHEIIGQLLDQEIGGDAIWTAGPDARRPRAVARSWLDEGASRLFLDPENVPGPVLDAWRGAGAEVITGQQWRGQRPRDPGLFVRVGPVTSLGPLVRVHITRHAREARAADQGPSGWAAGHSYTLLRTGTGWTIVAVAIWVT